MCWVADFWSWLSSNAANVIALCAFFATFWQAYISRRHNQLSVTPNLITWTHLDDKDEGCYFSVDLLNNGVGPATIKEFDVYVDGVQIQAEKEELIEQALRILFSEYRFKLLHSAYFLPGYIMPANEKRKLINVLFSREKSPTRKEIKSVMSRARLKIVYESIYKQEHCFDSVEQSLN